MEEGPLPDGTRRQFLRGGMALATLPLASRLTAAAAAAEAAQPNLTIGWSFIAKRPEISATQLFQGYEGQHAPGAVAIFAKWGIVHYERNYVRRSVGTRPPFDVISEFGSRPGATKPSMCGKPNDPNWKSSHVMEVRETLISGALLPFQKGPVLKRAILLRRPVDASADVFAQGAAQFAAAVSQSFGAASDRISLYMQSGPIEDILACKPVGSICEAVVMIWPKDGTFLPDSLPAPGSVAISSIIDLEAFASEIPA
ncbi:hypothetical protein BV96_00362 [Sphingomonas paucimobilis]|nr:hypothetical protein BV96_00362 [Sphingomonas paucimobilis]